MVPELLILTSPVANTAFQIHPGLPQDRQRLNVAGYAANNVNWASLRLIKDGDVLAMGNESKHLATWWILEPGEHRFWLEGEMSSGEEHFRSESALVIVEEFPIDQALAMP